jgi:hypothetical protein
VTGTCARCGAHCQIELHHPLGRDLARIYLDASLVVPMCIPCHRGAHVCLRALGVNHPCEPTPYVVLARASALIGWLSIAGQPITFEPLALGRIALAMEGPVRTLRDFDRAVTIGASRG